MTTLKIKKLHPDAIIPKQATEGAACFDIHAHLGAPEYRCNLHTGDMATFPTGLAFEIPIGYVMLVFSRSGHGFNQGVRLSNCVGVIDSDFRGELKISLTVDGSGMLVQHGDRIAQAMLIQLPFISIVEVAKLTHTIRGEGGFGSTGK